MLINRILVIQTSFIGDVIMSTPLLRAIRQLFPVAELDVLIIPGNIPLLEGNPNVDHILTFPKKNKVTKFFHFLRLSTRICRNRYDLAFSLTISFTSSLLMLLAGIPNRAGYTRQKLLTHAVRVKKGLPVRLRHMQLLTPFTTREFSGDTEIFWDNSHNRQAAELLGELKVQRPLIGIAPGSVRFTKRWPQAYFTELTAELGRLGLALVFLGSKAEEKLCSDIIAAAGISALNLAGKTDLKTLTAVISRLDLLIVNDSGPLHIANAVKTPVLAFFGPTVQEFGCYPFGEKDIVLEVDDLKCRPCRKHGGRKCPEQHFRCLREITPQIALSAVNKILGGMGGSA